MELTPLTKGSKVRLEDCSSLLSQGSFTHKDPPQEGASCSLGVSTMWSGQHGAVAGPSHQGAEKPAGPCSCGVKPGVEKNC